MLLADTPAPAERVREARSALVKGEAAFAEIAGALDLRLRTDLLVPLSRWVTPVGFPRRFDARFFVASLPDGIEPTFEGGEVAAHTWLRPTDALDAMADGRLAMWLPTSTTLQQLEHATSIEEIAERLAPRSLADVEVEPLSGDVTRIVMPAGGGVAGQPVCSYLVGHRRFVLIDPGDPTGPALERAIELAAAAGGTIEAVALTHVDPDHAAGAEADRLATRDPRRRRTGSRPAAPVPGPRARRRRGRSLWRCPSSSGPHTRAATRASRLHRRRWDVRRRRRSRWRSRSPDAPCRARSALGRRPSSASRSSCRGPRGCPAILEGTGCCSYGRSVGRAVTRFRRKLRPSATCSAGAYGPGIRTHGRPASATSASRPQRSSSGRPAEIVATRL